MVISISPELQWKVWASGRSAIKPNSYDNFLLSKFNPKFTRVRMLNTYFSRSCSISSNNNSSSSSSIFVDQQSIMSSCNFFPICNLFNDNQNHFKLMPTLSRMLASSVLVLVVMTMTLFCTQDSAFAVSYGSMGGGSSSSSSSSSDDDDYYYSSSSSNCNTRRIKKYKDKRESCSDCNCYKKKNKDERKSCTDCNCFEEKESSSSTVTNSSLSTSNCNCNCHIPCKCSCHVPVKTIAKPLFIILCIGAVLCILNEAMSEDLKNNRRGSVLMVQVGIFDKKRVLQRKLNRIAGIADTLTKSGLNCTLKDVVKALLEHHDSCHFSYLYAKYDHMEKYSRPCFRRFLETEFGKFDKDEETFVNVDGVKRRKESVGKVFSTDNEYLVVTLLVLADGEYLIPSLKRYTPHVKKVDVKTTLQTIHSIGRSNLEAVEVLWTPQRENDVVSEQDVHRDFGRLMRPVDF